MRRRRLLQIAAVWALALPPDSSGAADISGTWIGTIPKRDRAAARDVAFRFVQEGTALRGKAYNDRGSSDPIVIGSVSAGKVEFDVEASEQAGNQINIVIYRFRGTLHGTGIELERERLSARDASSGADVPVRRPSDTAEEDRARRFRSFRLERLFR